MQLLKLILLTLTFNTALAFAKSNVKVSINLNPVGSFEINSDQITGSITKTKNLLVAKEIALQVDSLKSGIVKRDRDMLQKFSLVNFPNIVIRNAIAKNSKGTAEIFINGTWKKISFYYSERKDKMVDVIFSLNLSDFKFKKIEFLGVSLKDKISIHTTLEVKHLN